MQLAFRKQRGDCKPDKASWRTEGIPDLGRVFGGMAKSLRRRLAFVLDYRVVVSKRMELDHEGPGKPNGVTVVFSEEHELNNNNNNMILKR